MKRSSLIAFAVLLAIGALVGRQWLAPLSGGEPAAPVVEEPAPTPPSELRLDESWPITARLPEGVQPAFERVVLVSIDTLRADHVSSYGYRRPTTPFLDSLAERGVLFERAAASVSHTAPSHATMLTGLPPAVHGVLQNFDRLDPESEHAGSIFRRAGFETAAALNVRFLRGIAPGFDFVDAHIGSGAPVVDSAVEWMRTKRTSERFFLWVHLYDPHHWKERGKTPSTELAEIRAATEMSDEELFEYLAGLHGLPEPDAGGRVELGWKVDVPGSVRQATGTAVRDYLDFVDAYDAQTLYADRLLRRLYEAVESLALEGSTLWIVTSDHGEGLASHGVAGHGGHIYQEQLFVPLVIHQSDDSLRPRRVKTLVQHTDLLPTLVEGLGGELEGQPLLAHGASLWPLLRDESGWDERPAFSQRRPPEDLAGKVTSRGRKVRAGAEMRAPDELYSIQNGRYKYILHEPGQDEFFDLESDPLELENRIEEANAERDALRALLDARLGVYAAWSRARASEGESEVLSEETIEELRALGYVE